MIQNRACDSTEFEREPDAIASPIPDDNTICEMDTGVDLDSRDSNVTVAEIKLSKPMMGPSRTTVPMLSDNFPPNSAPRAMETATISSARIALIHPLEEAETASGLPSAGPVLRQSTA